MTDEAMPHSESVGVDSLFIRHRNVLLARADMTPILSAARGHRKRHGINCKPLTETIFEQALAVFVLHCAARPRGEHVAWTINFQKPLLNLFLVADTGENTLTGRAFEEGVKSEENQNFYQELIAKHAREPVRSHVHFKGHDALLAAETFYETSEQRPARYFQTGPNQFAMLSAHPDWDANWFRGVQLDAVASIDRCETLSPIERRHFNWHCGCSKEKLIKVLKPILSKGLNDFFGNDDSINANCPRCAARFTISRTEAAALVAE